MNQVSTAGSYHLREPVMAAGATGMSKWNHPEASGTRGERPRQPAPSRSPVKPLLGLLTVASSIAAVLTSGTPAAAQYFNP
jgi:hypothetical protein